MIGFMEIVQQSTRYDDRESINDGNHIQTMDKNIKKYQKDEYRHKYYKNVIHQIRLPIFRLIRFEMETVGYKLLIATQFASPLHPLIQLYHSRDCLVKIKKGVIYTP